MDGGRHQPAGHAQLGRLLGRCARRFQAAEDLLVQRVRAGQQQPGAARLGAGAQQLHVGALQVVAAAGGRQGIRQHVLHPVKGILVAELNYGQIVNEVERAVAGKCDVQLCAKYNMEIFEPQEIESGIDKLCAGGKN